MYLHDRSQDKTRRFTHSAAGEDAEMILLNSISNLFEKEKEKRNNGKNNEPILALCALCAITNY